MFSEELNRLIEASLTDGILTDQELEAIKKLALLEGVDPNEVEIILESRIQEMQQQAQEAVAKVRKCPACGAIIASLQPFCPQCGTEISNVQAVSSIQKLTEKIEKINQSNSDSRTDKLVSTIKSHPVPMAREDLIEFIIAMQSRWKNTSAFEVSELKSAYKAKYDECLTKAQIMFPDDPAFQRLFQQAEKDNTAWAKFRNSSLFWPAIFVVGFILLGIIFYIFDK